MKWVQQISECMASNWRSRRGPVLLVMARWLAGIGVFCVLAWGQQSSPWQEDVRKYADARDWTAAMAIVDREIARAPQDMEMRSRRARVLTWSGRLAEAEREYHQILGGLPNDPDNWMGLAAVYSREGRPKQASQALDQATELDPTRADRNW